VIIFQYAQHQFQMRSLHAASVNAAYVIQRCNGITGAKKPNVGVRIPRGLPRTGKLHGEKVRMRPRK